MKDVIHVKGIVSKDEEDFWIITDDNGQVHDAGDLLSGIDH